MDFLDSKALAGHNKIQSAKSKRFTAVPITILRMDKTKYYFDTLSQLIAFLRQQAGKDEIARGCDPDGRWWLVLSPHTPMMWF